MADDRSSKDSSPKTSGSPLDRASQEQNDKSFSAGMHSLDSTQVPLRSEDAEPDWDAIKGKGKPGSKEQ